MKFENIYNGRNFNVQISADNNCVEIYKRNEIVAFMNRSDRGIIKGYSSLVLPNYIEIEANKLLDSLHKGKDNEVL